MGNEWLSRRIYFAAEFSSSYLENWASALTLSSQLKKSQLSCAVEKTEMQKESLKKKKVYLRMLK